MRVVGRQVVERDRRQDRAEAGEVGPDLDAVEVADDEQRRVAQVILVVEELEVRGLEVLLVALVLPGEEAALPDVGEAVPSPGLLHPALEGVLLAGGIGLVGRGLPHHPAQVDEVLLGRGLLGRGGRATSARRRRGQGGHSRVRRDANGRRARVPSVVGQPARSPFGPAAAPLQGHAFDLATRRGPGDPDYVAATRARKERA